MTETPLTRTVRRVPPPFWPKLPPVLPRDLAAGGTLANVSRGGSFMRCNQSLRTTALPSRR